jgi:hypothetical protein
MKKKSIGLVCLLCLSLVILASLGCIQSGEQPGPMQNESRYVPMGDVKSVNAKVTMGVGMLAVEGGAKDLMDANFIYNMASWKPEVSYSVSNGVGDLQVRQPSGGGVSLKGDVRYDWNLRFNDEVPLNLAAVIGTGDGILRLGGLPLTGFDVKSGASNLTLDFDGPWENDLNASIEAGVGELTIVLPQNTGAIVKVSQGVGSTEVGSGLKTEGNEYANKSNEYANDAYGKTNTTLRIDIQSGAGNTKLMLAP